MGLQRNARRHQAGIEHAEDWSDFAVGQRVTTVEGFPGVVTDVSDGPFPATEVYEVLLDDGMGGGTYDAGELTPIEGTTASVTATQVGEYTVPQPVDDPNLHMASEDYPELSEILVERPPLAHSEPLSMTAGKHDYDSGENDSGDDAVFEGPQVIQTEAGLWNSIVAPIVDKGTGYLDKKNPYAGENGAGSWSYDWCRFRRNRHCFYPDKMDMAATQQAGYAVFTPVDRGICGRDSWPDQKLCSVAAPGPKSGDPGALTDATIPWEQGGQHGGVVVGSRLQVEAAFEFTATWADVRKKASSIRTAGGVRVVSVVGDKDSGQTVTGEVRGSSAVYESAITSEPGRSNVAQWTCGCPWAAYSWGRSGRWKKYEGRMCAHALALTYEVQAKGMFGKNVVEDAEAPEWAQGDVQRPGDYVPAGGAASTSWVASLRPVTLDAELQPSVASWIAREMLDSGQEAEAAAHFGSKIMREAQTLDFKGRLKLLWNGTVRTVKEIVAETGTVHFSDGQQASVHDVHYPSYSPYEGLEFHASLISLAVDDAFEGDTAVQADPAASDLTMPASPDGESSGDDNPYMPDETDTTSGDFDQMWGEATQQNKYTAGVDDFVGEEEIGDTVRDADPEPALPETYSEDTSEDLLAATGSLAPASPGLEWLMKGGGPQGGQAGLSDGDIAEAAKQALSKMALKAFTPAERKEIIDEGVGVRASNFDGLDISGTHYEGLPDDDEDDLDLT